MRDRLPLHRCRRHRHPCQLGGCEWLLAADPRPSRPALPASDNGFLSEAAVSRRAGRKFNPSGMSSDAALLAGPWTYGGEGLCAVSDWGLGLVTGAPSLFYRQHVSPFLSPPLEVEVEGRATVELGWHDGLLSTRTHMLKPISCSVP